MSHLAARCQWAVDSASAPLHSRGGIRRPGVAGAPFGRLDTAPRLAYPLSGIVTRHILIATAATLGIWLFSAMLSGGTEALGKRFRIKPSIRGATLDATASSFPEFCTVILSPRSAEI